jgi:hypothetical protein
MNEVVIPLKLSGIAALKAELKDLKNQMADAANPEAFAALADKAGDVQKQINKVNNSINDFKKGSNLDQAKASFDAMGESIMKLDFTKAAKQSANLKQTLGSLTPADLTKGFKGFITTLKNLGGAFVKLGVTILMNPIFLLVAVIVAVVAAVALFLHKIGMLETVLKIAFAPIYIAITLLKELGDWLGITAFAAEDNAARTLAANEKVKKSSEERTAIVTADLGREIAEAKAAGEDTTKLEEKVSNIKIKEANNRKKTAIDAIEKQKALGKKADKEKLEELRKQVIAENEIIKQGYSDKIVARNAADKKEKDDAKAKADAYNKEAETKAKAARDKRLAADKAARDKRLAADKAARDKRLEADKASEAEIAAARKIVTDSTKTAQQIELDDLAAAYKKKIAEAVKYKNDTTALVEAQKVQEAAIIKKYDDAAKAAKAASHAANIAKIDAYNLELAALTDTEEQKLYDKYQDDKIKFADNELALFNLSKKYAEDTTALKKTEADKQKAIDDATFQAKKSIIASEIDAAKGLVDLLGGLGEKNKKIQKAALIANAALSIAEIINNSNVGASKEVATKGVLGLSTSALLYIKMATSIASVVAATAKGLSALGGGSVTPPSDTTGGGGGGGDTSTTAVAPVSGPNLFGNANTGSQVNAGGSSSNNITVTAIVSETEITASQQHINNIQQNSVL